MTEAVAQEGPGRTNRLREGFVALAESLLSSISDVFPECDETRSALELFRVLLKGDAEREDAFVRKCTRLFKEHSARLKEHDAQALFEVVDGIELLKGLDIRAKWQDPDFTPDSKDALWQYLASLETYGSLYCAVPSGVMTRVEQVASSMAEQLAAGTLDLSRLDLASFGDGLMSDLSPEDMREFESSLPELYSCVGSVASAVAKQAGNDAFDGEGLVRRLAEAQGGDGPPDMASFVQEMSSAVCPGQSAEVSRLVSGMAEQVLAGQGTLDVGQLAALAGGLAQQAPPALADAEAPKAPQRRRRRHR